MKVLRSSLYAPDLEPLTTVVRDVDLKVGIGTAAERSKSLAGAFIAQDIFTMGEADIVEATAEAVARLERVSEREKNAAMLYHWNALQLPRVTNVLSGTLPAPLRADEIVSALTQLAEHPDYKGQTVIAISEDMEVVLMRNGECEVKALGDES